MRIDLTGQYERSRRAITSRGSDTRIVEGLPTPYCVTQQRTVCTLSTKSQEAGTVGVAPEVAGGCVLIDMVRGGKHEATEQAHT